MPHIDGSDGTFWVRPGANAGWASGCCFGVFGESGLTGHGPYIAAAFREGYSS